MALRQNGLPFSIPNVLPQRRISCGFSAILVAVASLAALAGAIAVISGVIWLISHTSWFPVLLCSLMVGTAVYSLGRAIFAGRRTRAQGRQRQEELARLRGEEVPTGPSLGERAASLGKKFGIAFSLIGMEALLLYFWAKFPPLVLHDFWDKTINPAGIGINLVEGGLIQSVMAFGCWIVWCLLDKRAVPTTSMRLLMVFFMMMIPLWGMHLNSLMTFIKPVQGALLGFVLTCPLVGFILGAAYSCEENLFDKMRLRS